MNLLALAAIGLLLPCAMGSRVLTQATAPPTPELATALALTNFYRAQFQAPPLAWSAAIYQLAANAIQNCTESPSVAGYGRNVGYGYDSWGAFINKTAADQDKYDPTKPEFTPAAGLFTQLVWKGSTQQGCASKQCPRGPLYICLFSPPGNVQGQFATNVGTKGNTTTNTTVSRTMPASSPVSSTMPASGPVSSTMPAPAPVSGTTTSGGAPPAELAAGFARINELRGMYKAAPLKWDKVAYKDAADYVKSCPTMVRPVEGYAVNAGYSYATLVDFVDGQEADKCTYNKSSPTASLFTHLVWKATTSVGCAVNPNCGADGKQPNYVCLFSPAGGYDSSMFAANVETPTTAQLSSC